MSSVINATTTNGVAISPDNSGSLQLATNNGTTAVTIDTSQNVGVGITPSARLHAYDASNGTVIYANSGQTGAFLRFGNSVAQAGYIGYEGSGGNNLTFYTSTTERMRINSSGNVLIGTTADIGNTPLQIATTGSPLLTCQLSSGSANDYSLGGFLGYDGSNLNGDVIVRRATSTTTGYIAFRTNGGSGVTERMRITSGGNLLVGTTTSLGGRVNIEAGTSGQTTPIMIGNGSGSARAAMNYDVDNVRLGFGCGTTPTTNGVYLANGGTSWTSASDERLKENLVPITDAVNKVSSLRAVTGNFIADETKASKSFLIAQDVQKVLPEAVDASDPEKLGLQYQDVIPLLVSAIKELKAELDTVKAELNTLKNPPVEGTE